MQLIRIIFVFISIEYVVLSRCIMLCNGEASLHIIEGMGGERQIISYHHGNSVQVIHIIAVISVEVVEEFIFAGLIFVA